MKGCKRNVFKKFLSVVLGLSIFFTTGMGSMEVSAAPKKGSTVDLIIFAGQSNMMGHGNAAEAPKVVDGTAYELKIVTNKKKVKKLKEPFGYGQDSGNLVNGSLCTGSMVSSFCNAYYKETQTPVVAVAATKAGSGSVGWSTVYYKDVEKRINQSVKALKKMKLNVRHCYLVWMQGENDVCAGTMVGAYVKRIGKMLKTITKDTAVERCMLIKTGSIVYNMGTEEEADASKILKAQDQICKKYKQVLKVSNIAATMGADSYQADHLHFTQKALNSIGEEAGRNAGKYANKKSK